MTTHSRSRSAITVLAFAALALFVLISTHARAAGPWYVTPGGSDGNSCLSPAAACATINGAIGKATAGDTIKVATGVYTSTTGSEVVLLDKSATLSGGWDATFTTQGGMSTIDGDGARRGITVSNSVTAVIERFIIQNGSTPYIVGGGILNEGTLTLNNSTVSDNASEYNGGGISNRGILTLNKCTVSGNTASIFFGGGIHNDHGTVTVTDSVVSGNGGGIHNDYGTLTLTNSAVNGNTNPSGVFGGIYNGGGTLSLTNSTVSDNLGNGIINIYGGTLTLNNSFVNGNTAYFGGVGIDNVYGTVTLTDSAVSGNTSQSSGGGILNGGVLILNNSTVSDNTSQENGGGISNGGTLTLNNSTVSGNTSQEYGGGISNGGTLTLNNSTISGNTSDLYNGGGFTNYNNGIVTLNNGTVSNNKAYVGGGIYNESGTVTLKNSILAGNTATGTDPDCNGTISSEGYNLIGNTTNCTITGDTTGNITGINPLLGPLQDNGGPTLTHALMYGSPAIDAGNPAGCIDNLGNPLNTDQRGIARVGRCDIGSYDFDPDHDPLKYIFLPLISR